MNDIDSTDFECSLLSFLWEQINIADIAIDWNGFLASTDEEAVFVKPCLNVSKLFHIKPRFIPFHQSLKVELKNAFEIARCLQKYTIDLPSFQLSNESLWISLETQLLLISIFDNQDYRIQRKSFISPLARLKEDKMDEIMKHEISWLGLELIPFEDAPIELADMEDFNSHYHVKKIKYDDITISIKTVPAVQNGSMENHDLFSDFNLQRYCYNSDYFRALFNSLCFQSSQSYDDVEDIFAHVPQEKVPSLSLLDCNVDLKNETLGICKAALKVVRKLSSVKSSSFIAQSTLHQSIESSLPAVSSSILELNLLNNLVDPAIKDVLVKSSPRESMQHQKFPFINTVCYDMSLCQLLQTVNLIPIEREVLNEWPVQIEISSESAILIRTIKQFSQCSLSNTNTLLLTIMAQSLIFSRLILILHEDDEKSSWNSDSMEYLYYLSEEILSSLKQITGTFASYKRT